MDKFDLCSCGRDKLTACPGCGRQVKTVNGKFVTHDSVHCTGSHLEYKTCKQSGKVAK